MNFEQLKDQWNENGTSSNEISEKMLKVREAHTPIDNIRKKMKNEFFVQLLSLIIMIFAPKVFGFSQQLSAIYFLFYAIACGFTAYYFFKFYTFYTHSYDLSLDSRKNLLWFYYEMKLNVELYKALTYIIGFIALAFSTTALVLLRGDILTKLLTKISMTYVVLNAFVAILIIGIITELWARFYYGKYLKQIKTIVDGMDEE
ncbi:hypothetical protein [Pedobacter ureilyticus]|jgi:hypothetical protein|uniref:Uncharacterized protein n=1 Tax=Pedobacter ureilyticus TaxID=1393051 RepID=A0ABW9J0C3_9SPHI|nr:hypothetical protein [Pedobacter helvus]